MSRRVSLPGASELFRPTHAASVDADPNPPPETVPTPTPPTSIDQPVVAEPGSAATPARGSGRVRHDEKITVYVSSDELLELEQARLTLRAKHGLAIDRGRIVREAISAAMADFEAGGGDSELVRRLSLS